MSTPSSDMFCVLALLPAMDVCPLKCPAGQKCQRRYKKGPVGGPAGSFSFECVPISKPDYRNCKKQCGPNEVCQKTRATRCGKAVICPWIERCIAVPKPQPTQCSQCSLFVSMLFAKKSAGMQDIDVNQYMNTMCDAVSGNQKVVCALIVAKFGDDIMKQIVDGVGQNDICPKLTVCGGTVGPY